MEKINIIIADDNIEFGELLKKYLSKYGYIKVLGVAQDGFEAVEMIKSFLPDIVILDIIMPNLDGIGVLEKVPELGLKKKPLFIMLSAIGQDVFVQKAIDLGAEYYIVKPFSVDILAARIKQIYNEKCISPFSTANTVGKKPTFKLKRFNRNTDIEARVTDFMRNVCIPPHVTGYQYIREAIIQTIYNDEVFNSVTKMLYPSVAKKFKTTPQRVERAIRNAIESAWTRCKPADIEKVFGYRPKDEKDKPTNSEFIHFVANKVKSELGLK